MQEVCCDLNYKFMKTIENSGMDYIMIAIIMLYLIMPFLQKLFLRLLPN